MRHLLALTFAICLLGAFPTHSCAQRTVKELAEMTKNCEASQVLEMGTLGFGFSRKPYRFTSLRNVDSTLLNTVEDNLLSKYDDVLTCSNGGSFQHCYYVIDSVGRVGMYRLDGENLVPPLSGLPHTLLKKGVVVGDVEYDDKKWLGKFGLAIQEHNGRGMGHFQAFVRDVWSDKIHVVIPAGRYDDIQLTIKGQKYNFYAAKMDDKDTLRWGLVNMNGKEDLPCEYLGIYKKNSAMGFMTANVGGKYIATNEMTMAQADRLVENREEVARHRREAWARYLNATAELMFASAEMIDQVQSARGVGNSGTASSSSSSSSGGSYQQQYNNWERRAESCYNSLTNLGISSTNKKTGETSGSTLQSMSGSNYTQMKKSLREAQNEMKKIRQKAKKQGITIAQSQWETATVKY